MKEAATLIAKPEFTASPTSPAKKPKKVRVKKKKSAYMLFQAHKIKEIREMSPHKSNLYSAIQLADLSQLVSYNWKNMDS